VTAEIIPYLRLIAPTVINVEQGTPASEPIATDYVIGKVTYAKGAGTWPAGLDVNLQTGAIVGTPTAAKGDYPGLKIVGTDTFGSFKDIQSSNSFTIHVNPTTAKPVISNIASNSMIFGTVGTFAEFTPTVVDNVAFKPWRYEGTVYKLNKALPQGLNFDTVTGRIYGTAQQATIIPDLTITVTSELGDSATTAPFSFEVKPQTTTLRLTIYGSTDVHACMGYIQLFMGGTDVFPQAALYLPPGSYGFGTDPDNLKDPSLVQGGHGKDGGLLCWNYSNGSWLDITVPVGMSSGQILLYQRNDEWGYGALFTDVSLSITNKDGSLSQLVRQAIPNAHPGQIVTLGF
jgi:hypothetical protein